MKINTNKAYAMQAAETMEQVVATAFMLALHRHHRFGKKRLNALRQQATDVMTDYYKYCESGSQYRGTKYQTAGIVFEVMARDLKAIGVEGLPE